VKKKFYLITLKYRKNINCNYYINFINCQLFFFNKNLKWNLIDLLNILGIEIINVIVYHMF